MWHVQARPTPHTVAASAYLHEAGSRTSTRMAGSHLTLSDPYQAARFAQYTISLQDDSIKDHLDTLRMFRSFGAGRKRSAQHLPVPALAHYGCPPPDRHQHFSCSQRTIMKQ